MDGINAIYHDAARDPELKGWFKHMDVFIRKALKEEGYILKDSSTDEWNKLYEQGEFLLRDRYRNHTQRLVDEVQFITDQMAHDPMNKAFGDALQKMFLDLGNDENGKPTFKPHLLKDLANVVVPGFFESVSYVPIPRIEYSDPMADAIIENLVIESDNLTPNMLEFGNDNYFRWGRKTVASRNKNKVMISASGIQMDLKGETPSARYLEELELTFCRRQLLHQEETRFPIHHRHRCHGHLLGRKRFQLQGFLGDC